MIETMYARVTDILSHNGTVTEIALEISHEIKKAVNYDHLTGKIQVGDKVLVNTTAGTLGLGTGGVHFIISNVSNGITKLKGSGHGMKLKYTPIQFKVPFVEEESKLDIYNKPLDLRGVAIFFCELHSMLPPLCAYLKYHSKENIKIGYIMTDHGALPVQFSKNVHELKGKKLLDGTITFGNSFGGDYECVNFYTALQTAVDLMKCDVVIVSMGPGIIGTGTKYGFSGLETGLYYNLAKRHNGRCFLIPRVGFHDSRDRHRGISHHSLTILGEIILGNAEIILPHMTKEQYRKIKAQIKNACFQKKTKLKFLDGRNIEPAMECYNINTKTMGRSIFEEPLFFHCIGAVAKAALLDKDS